MSRAEPRTRFIIRQRNIIARAVSEFGKVDILVANAAYQMTRTWLEDIPDDEWDYGRRVQVPSPYNSQPLRLQVAES